jgi:hypothetical protein
MTRSRRGKTALMIPKQRHGSGFETELLSEIRETVEIARTSSAKAEVFSHANASSTEPIDKHGTDKCLWRLRGKRLIERLHHHA